MIILKLSGGLGNQMFEYAYGLWVSKYFNEDLIIDCTEFELDEIRELSLQHLNIENLVFLDDSSDVYDDKNAVVLNKDIVSIKNARKMSSHSNQSRIKLELSFFMMKLSNIYYKNFFRRKNKVIDGFYQSEYYFYPIRNKIKEIFKVNTEPSPKNKEIIETIDKSNSVCVHIRRGDYLNSEWSSLQVCTSEYFYKAVDYMKKQLINPVFFVFSNCHEDIEYIKHNFKFDGNFVYVDLQNPDYEELRLMMSCKHFIISNSTFSWWAQYLSDYNDKIVIAPKVWDKNGHRSEVYQENWILM